MLRVVKLGGSLYRSPHLAGWLAQCSNAGGSVVLVPGGGPFADQVRTAQAQLGFDDAHAHTMALLAMEQFGLALCGMAPGLEPATTPEDIAHSLARQRTPVWLPSRMCSGAPDIAESWSVTSDSLAAWLATRLQAEALALVKHTSPGMRPYVQTLGEASLDTAFSKYATAYGGPIHILGHADPGVLPVWLSQANL